MALSFVELKSIDISVQFLVFGFVRNIEKVLNLNGNDNTLYIVSELISYLCLGFYFVNEYFGILGDSLVASNNNETIQYKKNNTDTCNWENITYGNIIIPSTSTNVIYSWTLKPDNVHFMIGIASKHDQICDVIWKTDESKGDYKYFLWAYRGQISSGEKDRTWDTTLYAAIEIGDEITMKLEFGDDNTKPKLSFMYDGVDQGVAFDHIRRFQ